MTDKVLFVDGHNVLNARESMQSLLHRNPESARDSLVRYVTSWISGKKQISGAYIVFDGAGIILPQSTRISPVRIVYSPPGTSADDQILHLVRAENRRCLVVTNDRELRIRVEECKAETLTVEEFVRLSIRTKKHGKKRRSAPGTTTREKLSIREQEAVTREFLEIWDTEEAIEFDPQPE